MAIDLNSEAGLCCACLPVSGDEADAWTSDGKTVLSVTVGDLVA